MSVARSRLTDLVKAQCNIFSTTFNPAGLRLGNKILRQRLRGPALAAYYPRKVVTHKDLTKNFPGFNFLNEAEMLRQWHLNNLRIRGKSRPKKKKEAANVKGSKK